MHAYLVSVTKALISIAGFQNTGNYETEMTISSERYYCTGKLSEKKLSQHQSEHLWAGYVN